MSNQKDYRVRIAINHDGARKYFVKFDGDRVTMVDFNSVNSAALMSRDVAIVAVKKLQASGWDAFVITRAGTRLYANELAAQTKPQVEKTPERERMHCNGVLIVPASLGRWAIRFPQSNWESIYAATPEEAYEKLTQHPRYPELAQLVERYIPAPEPLADPEQIKQALQRERYGNTRTRPGDLRA